MKLASCLRGVRHPGLIVLVAAVLHLSGDCRADDAPTAVAEPAYSPFVAAASDEAKKSLVRIRVPDGFKVELFAAEPLLANPVALCLDHRGRAYVCETFRHFSGVTDNRDHMYWLADDLACQTVEDRVAMFRKHLGDRFASYTTEHERLRLVSDADGDGVADTSSVFADGFKDPADGIAAGVLVRGNDVFYACLPHLWLLRDEDHDGQADRRQSLHSGYGVHVAFLGHDLHGLIMGPDGRLYFSMGDRGFNVQADGRQLVHPHTGAVLRCLPDGSQLEVFATGLRNPQELAFDDHGNLFTCDNNSDGGDKARWVHVLEGSDAGWRMYYQYITKPVLRGPWNAEKLWHPQHEGQAAYIVPPLANLADGPSGLAYDPGTGLADAWRSHFFLCDFRGVSSLSGIRALSLKPRGASFEVADVKPFVQSLLATDAEFGPDGSLYALDWVEGWNKTGKGRIYRVTPNNVDPRSVQVKALLAQGMVGRAVSQLLELLAHADRRVRQEAQFALAAQGDQTARQLAELAGETSAATLPRLHAIWALGQIGRQTPSATAPVVDLLADKDPEVRCQAAKVASEARRVAAVDAAAAMLKDDNARVRLFGAEALGRLGMQNAVPSLLGLLRDNDDQDPFLRHAAVLGLSRCAGIEALSTAAADPSPAVRMGVLLALRRLGSAEIARFLRDPQPRIVLEAARAIYDLPLETALPQLAALVDRAPPPGEAVEANGPEDALWRRILAANLRIGARQNLESMAAFAGRADAPMRLRVEALEMLAQWHSPASIDRVVGAWRPLAPRAALDAGPTLARLMAQCLGAESPEAVQIAAADATAKLHLASASPALESLAENSTRLPTVRVAALAALGAVGSARLDGLVQAALQDKEPAVRGAGLNLLAKLSPELSAPIISRVLDGGDAHDQQAALAALAVSRGPAAEELTAAWLDKLLAGETLPEVELELLEAAAAHATDAIRQRIAQFDARRDPSDTVAPFREALFGGDKARGRDIFFDKTEAACLRCHKIISRGGEVGPNLTDVGKRLERRAILESLVAPNAQIAKGFESVVCAMQDGQTHVGVLKSETEVELQLINADGLTVRVPKVDIEERSRGISAMPDKVTQALTKRELRDLVAFLASLK